MDKTTAVVGALLSDAPDAMTVRRDPYRPPLRWPVVGMRAIFYTDDEERPALQVARDSEGRWSADRAGDPVELAARLLNTSRRPVSVMVVFICDKRALPLTPETRPDDADAVHPAYPRSWAQYLTLRDGIDTSRRYRWLALDGEELTACNLVRFGAQL